MGRFTTVRLRRQISPALAKSCCTLVVPPVLSTQQGEGLFQILVGVLCDLLIAEHQARWRSRRSRRLRQPLALLLVLADFSALLQMILRRWRSSSRALRIANQVG